MDKKKNYKNILNNYEKNISEFLHKHLINEICMEEKKLKVIKKIYNIMSKYVINKEITKKPVFNNLANVVSDKKILLIAYNNIRFNVKFAIKQEKNGNKNIFDEIEKLSLELKKNKYELKTVRQVVVSKPRKSIKNWTKNRLIKFKKALSISDLFSSIVQESIRIILSAIYEPLFDSTNTYGFSPKYSYLNAVIKINNETKKMKFSLQGQVKQLFDTINYEVLSRIASFCF